jgi:hypothetical protein
MESRRYIIWLVKGLGGLVKLIEDWYMSFGTLPDDQALVLKDYLCRLKFITESSGKPRTQGG